MVERLLSFWGPADFQGLCWFQRVYLYFCFLNLNVFIWSNYSGSLTRPISPKGSFLEGKWDPLFQGNLGEGEILFHLVRFILPPTIVFKKRCIKWKLIVLFPKTHQTCRFLPYYITPPFWLSSLSLSLW